MFGLFVVPYISGAIALAFALAANRLQRVETTFAWGTWPLLVLMVAAGLLVAAHLWRLLSAYSSYNAEAKKCFPPAADKQTMEYLGIATAVAYLPLVSLWLFAGDHSRAGRFFPPVALLALGLATWYAAKRDFYFGLKVSTARVAEQSPVGRGRDWPEEEGLDAKARRSAPKIKFADIYGNAAIKRRLLDAGKAIMVERAEGKPSRNGVLLFGEPGNGKTVFAEAMAGELGLPLYTLTQADVGSKWIGEATSRLKASFDQAISNQPCVLFIDEIDSLLPDRNSLMSGTYLDAQNAVNALLTLLVDVRAHRVLVMAATNYVDRLDPAAIREGRFDFKVEITPPDEEARIGLLQSGLKGNLPKVQVASEAVRNVAARWNGFSVKRILAVTEELPSYLAEERENGRARAEIGYNDFMAALRRLQGRAGAKPENVKSLSEMVLPAGTRESLEMIAGRMRDPLRVERLGGTLPTGVLFYGPAGTGKTSACKALAKEVGWAFLISSGTELARDPKALQKLHAQAKELRPAIIFIDEADDLLRSREYSNNTESTNMLLTLMDGVADRARDVVWVAATNHPDQIDAALLRGGRFTEKVEFVVPNGSQLTAHIDAWMGQRKLAFADGVDASTVSTMIGEESIANVEAVLQYAVNRAISHSSDDRIVVGRKDVAAAMSTVLGA